MGLSPEQRTALLITVLPEQLDKLCIARLESRGYVVSMPGKWESPAQVCKRLDISRSKFARRWKRYAKAQPEDVQLGPTGRLIAIRSNPGLDVFLVGPKRLVRRLTSQIVDVASVLTQQPTVSCLKSKRPRRKKAA